MTIKVIITIIIIVVIFIIMAFGILLGTGVQKTAEEKEYEDQEQIEYLREWTEKKQAKAEMKQQY